MAKTSNTLIGRSSGSVGGVTFQKWRRFNIIREKPSNQIASNTPQQQISRNVFKALSNFNRFGSLIPSNLLPEKIPATSYSDRVKMINADIVRSIIVNNNPTSFADFRFALGDNRLNFSISIIQLANGNDGLQITYNSIIDNLVEPKTLLVNFPSDDVDDDLELLDLVEMEIRELLSFYEFDSVPNPGKRYNYYLATFDPVSQYVNTSRYLGYFYLDGSQILFNPAL